MKTLLTFFLVAVATTITSIQEVEGQRNQKLTLQPVYNVQQKQDDSEFPQFNDFDTDFLRDIANEEDGNVLVSPASVKAALAILWEGTRGVTREEIANALGLTKDEAHIRRHFNRFFSSLKSTSNGIVKENVNSVFFNQRLRQNRDFNNTLTNLYYSQMYPVDFSNKYDTANKINEYIRGATRNLIQKVVEPDNFSLDTAMILINALYFKGVWKYEFDEKATRPGSFHTPDGVCHVVDMMENEADFKYGYMSRLDADIIELPYKDNKHTMLILLPRQVNGTTVLLRGLVKTPLENIDQALTLQEVEFAMPKFTIEYSKDLINTLQKSNIRKLFSFDADLSGIIQNGNSIAQISNIFHKTRIEVNEWGSEGAAVTGGIIAPLMSSSKKMMIVNRPFVFLIRDTSNNGGILFSGRVNLPNEVYTNLPTACNPRPAYKPTQKPIIQQSQSQGQGYSQPQSQYSQQQPSQSQGSQIVYPQSQPQYYQPQNSQVQPVTQNNPIVANNKQPVWSQPQAYNYEKQSSGTNGRIEDNYGQALNQNEAISNQAYNTNYQDPAKKHISNQGSKTENSNIQFVNNEEITAQNSASDNRKLSQPTRQANAGGKQFIGLRENIQNVRSVQPLVSSIVKSRNNPPLVPLSALSSHNTIPDVDPIQLPIARVYANGLNDNVGKSNRNNVVNFQASGIRGRSESFPDYLQISPNIMDIVYQQPQPKDKDGIIFKLN